MRRLDEICIDRRAIIAALPGLILLPGVVAACSSSTPSATVTKEASGAAAPEATAESSAAAAQGAQVPVSEVPVGSAVVVTGPPPYVVAQTAPNQFVAYSASCTHRGTTVKVGTGTQLVCPAHGSQFDATSGAVLKGPAASPLKSVPVSVDGGTITIG